MKYMEDIFLGVLTDDMDLARKVCESLLERPLKCTNSTFCGGDHCHTSSDRASYDLRLNHHDDGDGWSWCIDDPRYPLVLTCTFYSREERDWFFSRVGNYPLIEIPKKK
jgi:hypothetical protein